MMKLDQPVLFVGLGGTGCDVGAFVERQLREEICGSDGAEFVRARDTGNLLPYQLPSCVQFVYADMSQAELDRMPSLVVPGSQHIRAALATARYVRDLVPLADSYPQLALSLRLEAPRETAAWLPPPTGEPRVSPLRRGAGQFPTVGRAALFGTFLTGMEPAMRDLRAAIGSLATSGEDLAALGGRAPRVVDVFVAFSAAGGTGAGIFYDYLHIIGHLFSQSELKAQIYPLVLMPSAFQDGLGGGRRAELNAARALLDLFQLVDQQNSGSAEHYLRGSMIRRRDISHEEAVHYPHTGRIVLRPGTVQTGVLFANPIGAERSDLHHSIASLVLSLIRADLPQEDEQRSGGPHQLFADSWVNSGQYRQAMAENGIGKRGVSTALVASLTTPFDDLAGIIGGRLLRSAVQQLESPGGKPEENRAHMEAFLRDAGVHRVLARDGVSFAEPEPVYGAREVAMALNDRAEAMKAALHTLEANLSRDVPQLIGRFDPRGAIRELLGSLDAFRVQRVTTGHPELKDEIDKTGVAGLLQRRRVVPPAPNGFGSAPPGASELKNRAAGLIKVKWADQGPVRARRDQDNWYSWRTHVAWAEAWDMRATQWQRNLNHAVAELDELVRALTDFARGDEERFRRRAAELYRRRVGVSYLMPPGRDGLEHFYQQIVHRMTEGMVRDGMLQPTATEADLVQALVGSEGWREAYVTSFEQSPTQAVADLRDLVKSHVKTFLQDPSGQRPLLPKLHDLLVAAVGHRDPDSQQDDYVSEFRRKLAGLVPAAFTPQGSGPMKVLITYPADAPSRVIEAYLREAISLPAGPGIVYDISATHAESISVVLFRTSMGVTEVNEVRDMLRLWSDALARPEPGDLLRWRQRTGYEFGYLATTEEDRVEILHRLLCALWNGSIRAEGDPQSPQRIQVELGGVTMSLPLASFQEFSSWGSVLRSYELWTLDGDEARRLSSARLMRELPFDLDGRCRDPSPLYLTMVSLADSEVARLDDILETLPARNRGRAAQLRSFWAETLPAALNRPFAGADSPIRPTLRELGASLVRRDE